MAMHGLASCTESPVTSHVRAPNLHATVLDGKELRDTFREDVLHGLSLPHKSIPPKHLYDARGSKLFDAITGLNEYYPTRTERNILDSHAESIAGALGPGATLIEPGAGSCEKAQALLATLEQPRSYVPIEISLTALEAGSHRIAERFPHVEVHPICTDFTTELPLTSGGDNRVVFFPGSTVSNFNRKEREGLLKRLSDLAQPGGQLLIGFDLAKDRSVLLDAYNDSAGVTAAFNLNLLRRINAELGGDFDLSMFRHDAVWNDEHSRIEMHLVSEAPQGVRVEDQMFEFAHHERLHTENSHKFTTASFDIEAGLAGFSRRQLWTDPQDWFAVALYRAD